MKAALSGVRMSLDIAIVWLMSILHTITISSIIRVVTNEAINSAIALQGLLAPCAG